MEVARAYNIHSRIIFHWKQEFLEKDAGLSGKDKAVAPI